MQKLTLLFPGGGTQYTGMGKLWYDGHPTVKLLFEEANDIVGFNLRRTCFEGDLLRISTMEVAQPAIFTVSMAACVVWQQTHERMPDFAAGHSLGEFAALTAAGMLSFSEMLKLITLRGRLLMETGKRLQATMMAVNKLEAGIVEEACATLQQQASPVFVAVYNSPLQQVIAGSRTAVVQLSAVLKSLGGETVMLPIDTPSHCPLMADAATEFKGVLAACNWQPALFPVMSNVTGLPYSPTADVADLLTRHMVSPVKWWQSMLYLQQEGVTQGIELGPQAVLKQLMPFITDQISVTAMDVAADVVKSKTTVL